MLVVQPHFDDAVLGLGHRMAQDDPGPSVLVTALAGRPDLYPPLLMRPHDETCGFVEGDDVMDARAAEDVAAGAVLGWGLVHVPLLDTQYMGGGLRRSVEDAEVLMRALGGAWEDARRPREVWCPAAVNHPDHEWVRDVVADFADRVSIALYVWMEPGYRSTYRDAALRIEEKLTGQTAIGIPWGEARDKLDLVRNYRSQMFAIPAVTIIDALAEEVWGRWT